MAKQERIVYQEFGAREAPDLERDSQVVDLPPQRQNLSIQASRAGRKGKTVTVIAGFECSPATLVKLLKQLKTKCGTGGTLKDNQLEIQGDRRQELSKILTDLGYKVKISGG